MPIDLSLIPDGGAGWLDASGEHADVVLLHGREQLVLRALVEDVVDHLHRVDVAGAH